jgi:hypothetical protein
MIPFPYQTGQLGRRAVPVAGGDPNFADVSLLLHFDGTNGSTTFVDSSSNALSPSSVLGNAQISTVQSKFGGASGLFDGAGDQIVYASSALFGFGTGDYTVEGFVRFSNASTNRCLLDTRLSISPFTGMAIYVDQAAAGFQGRLTLVYGTAGVSPSGTTQFAASSAFQHFAVSKSGTTVRGFIDGVQVWSITNSTNLGTSSNAYIGGALDNSQGYNGYLDEFRITKGVGRYTANFTPPTAPFPDS